MMLQDQKRMQGKELIPLYRLYSQGNPSNDFDKTEVQQLSEACYPVCPHRMVAALLWG